MLQFLKFTLTRPKIVSDLPSIQDSIMRMSVAVMCVALGCGVAAAEGLKPSEKQQQQGTQGQPVYDIGEFNRRYWGWKRCMSRWEKERGMSDAAGAAKLCGTEPQLPK